MADREGDNDVKSNAPEDAEQLRGVSGDDDFDNDDLDDEEDTDQEGSFLESHGAVACGRPGSPAGA